MRKLTVIIFIALIAGFSFSCKKDNASRSRALLVIKSTFDKSTLVKGSLTETSSFSISKAFEASGITLDTFLINIKNIDFELDDECNDDCNDDCNDKNIGLNNKSSDDCDNTHDDNLEITGPFLIDLLSPEALAGLPVASLDLPNAAYDEIEFKLDKYQLDKPKVIYHRSIYISGKVNGKTLRMWYSGDYDFKIEFPGTSEHFILTGDDLKMYLDFHINNMLTSLSKIDFSTAVDRNGNGIIEIGSDDTDGNKWLAHHIIEAVLESCDLDDQYDDD